MKDRILRVMNHYGMSQQQFAQTLDVAPATISSIFNGRTNPTLTHVQAIHRTFPAINTQWLAFGEGEMFVAGSEESQLSPSLHEEANVEVSNGELLFLDTEEKHGVSTSITQQNTPVTVSNAVKKQAGSQADRAGVIAGKEAEMLGEVLAITKMLQAKSRESEHRRIREIRVFYDDGTYEAFGALQR